MVPADEGPLSREDYVSTRLIELVVHGDDLHRALNCRGPSPVLPGALTRVADVFADAHTRVTGHAPAWWDLDLVRLATGRTPSTDPALPLLR